MKKNIELKKDKVKDIIQNIDNSKSIYLFNYNTISASELNQIKMNNIDKGIKIVIFKNTLAKIAFQQKNFSDVVKSLIGPTAFAFSKKEELLPGKIISAIALENPNVHIKACIVDNKVLSSEEANELCKYSSKKDMYATFAASLNFPLNRLILTIKAIAEKQS